MTFVFKVGDIIGRTLLDMRANGFNIDNFHLVGHSLGGHLMGFIGRGVYNQSNKSYKLKRITACDPAGPFFYRLIGAAFNKPLNKNDGEKYSAILNF